VKLTLKPPNRTLMTELETARFVLRPAGMLEILRDPGHWRSNPRMYRNIYLLPGPMSFRSWMKYGPVPDGVDRFLFAIVPKGSTTAIGYHMIRPNGYQTAGSTVGIHDDAWLGKDVAVEVRAKLMNHFFRHGGVERFSSRIESRNHPSIYTYRKLGFQHVGTLHREKPDPNTGEPIDYLLFEMLKSTWKRGPYAEPGL
jgi:RimJ/RimL family protein N-acetyltransferase